MSSTEGDDTRVGSQIGPYLLRRLLGRGGMGEVYEAEDTVKDRIVALKLLPEAQSNDPVFRKRLQREAHSAGRLQEPHVVPIHDYGEIEGHLFVDMRLIDGTDLRKILKSYGPMTPARAVAIVRQVAAALDAAHESGVMHRDVKPENIIVTRDDFAYLVDFGIANAATDEKLTELGTAVGTYAYMAPERFTNDEVTYRADIYALACVLHECLTGSQPYQADSVSVVITSHLMQPIPRPSERRPGVPSAFDEVIARGMAKKPEDRFASAGDLALAANNALTSRDQHQAATILERSAAATLPGQFTGGQPPTSQLPPTQATTPPPTYPPTPPPFMPGAPQPTPQPAAFQAPPYQPPGGPWTTPPPGPQLPSRKRSPWIPIAAAGAVIAVVLGGLGIWWIVKPGPSSPQGGQTTSTTTTTTTSQNTEANIARLLSILPRGYDGGACKPVEPVSDALATVDCGRNNNPGGPTRARYSLFAGRDALDKQFDEAIRQNATVEQCPGSGIDSPSSWHYQATPDKVEGKIACGTYDGLPDLVWSKNRDLLLGDAQSLNMAELHQWWVDFA